MEVHEVRKGDIVVVNGREELLESVSPEGVMFGLLMHQSDPNDNGVKYTPWSEVLPLEMSRRLLERCGFEVVDDPKRCWWVLKTENFEASVKRDEKGLWLVEISPNLFRECDSFQQLRGILWYLYGYNLEIKPDEKPVF